MSEPEEIRILLTGLPDDSGVHEEAVEEIFTSLDCYAHARLLHSRSGLALGSALVKLDSYESVKIAMDALHGKVLDQGATRIGIHLLLSPSSSIPASLATTLGLTLLPSPTTAAFPSSSRLIKPSGPFTPKQSTPSTYAAQRVQAQQEAQARAVSQAQAQAAGAAKLSYEDYLALAPGIIPPTRAPPAKTAPPTGPKAAQNQSGTHAVPPINGAKKPAPPGKKTLLSRIDIGLKDRLGGFVKPPTEYPAAGGKGKTPGGIIGAGLKGQSPAQQNRLIELQRARLKAAKTATATAAHPYAHPKTKAQQLQNRLASNPVSPTPKQLKAANIPVPQPKKAAKAPEKKKAMTQEELDEELKMLNRARKWGGRGEG